MGRPQDRKRGEGSPCQLRMLGQPVDENEVQLNQAEIHGRLVPVLGDTLPPLAVLEIVFLAVDAVEVTDVLLGCDAVSLAPL